MPGGRPRTTPCEECGKPIKPGAPKCWFCGSVFDTVPCPHCGRPLKMGSSHCQFCGDDVPIPDDLDGGAALTPLPPTRAERPPDHRIAAELGAPPGRAADEHEAPLKPGRYRECPVCGEVVSRAAVNCKYCGAQIAWAPAEQGWGRGGAHRPHRAGMILACAILSYFVCAPLGVVALVLAISDLRQMRAGRMDSSGEPMTWVALALAVIPTAVLAAVLVLVVVRLMMMG